MKNQTRQIIKNVIEENAVAFKENTAKLMYSKVKDRLEEEYKTVSQNILKPRTK
jgi:hypothetical protein